MSGSRAPRAVFLSAGESSGDLHGASLARALRRRAPGLELYGLGGERMAAAGVELLADLDDLAVMGLAEVVRRLPTLLRLRRRVRRFLVERGIDLLIPIDYPDFNLPLAKFAHGRGLPVLYYIAPQVWAWRERRARRLARACDRVCVVLPFEEPLLARYGADVRFVGHPLLDETPAGRSTGAAPPGAEAGSGAAAGGSRARSAPAGTAMGGRVLGLFPGSREHEVERMLPVFTEAAERLAATRPQLSIQVARPPHIPPSAYERAGLPVRPAESVLAEATAALCKSGTVTLQLALADVPMVVGHRMSPLTFAVARRVVRVPHVALVNLVAGKEVVPELLQDELTPEVAARRLEPLLDPDGAETRRMREGLKVARERLGSPGCADRVAEQALELVDGAA